MNVKVTVLGDTCVRVENQAEKYDRLFVITGPILSRLAGKKSASFDATIEHGSLHLGEALRT